MSGIPDDATIIQNTHELLKEQFELYDLHSITDPEKRRQAIALLEMRCTEILREVTKFIPDLWDGSYGKKAPLREALIRDEPEYSEWYMIIRYATQTIVHEIEASRPKKKWWQK